MKCWKCDGDGGEGCITHNGVDGYWDECKFCKGSGDLDRVKILKVIYDLQIEINQLSYRQEGWAKILKLWEEQNE